MSSLHKELGSYMQFRGTHFPSLPRAGEFSRTLAALTGQLQEDRGSSVKLGQLVIYYLQSTSKQASSST